jgi:hypothetical protein
MNNIYPKCFVCGQTPGNGLYDGIRLNRKLICSRCEDHIISTESGTMEYLENIRHIKEILYC